MDYVDRRIRHGIYELSTNEAAMNENIHCQGFVISISYRDESLNCNSQRLNKRVMRMTIGSRIVLGPLRGATSSTAIRSN